MVIRRSLVADGGRERVEQGGLARAGAAGDHGGDPALHRAVQELGDAMRHGAELDQPLQA